MATLGGNLLQRPRCWYFRSAHHHCARKGGEACFAFGGENQYHAIFDHDGCAIVHPSTSATALVALGASVELMPPMVRGVWFRWRSSSCFQTGHHIAKMISSRARSCPPSAAEAGAEHASVHLKQGEKDLFDWPIADVAVLLDRDPGLCRSFDRSRRRGAGAAPGEGGGSHAARQDRAEQTARDAASAALVGAAPLSKNAYKLPIFETLVRRAILAAVDL